MMLQNEDFKSETQITGAGGAKSQLLNDTKVYLTTVAETLDDAVNLGKIGDYNINGVNNISITAAANTPGANQMRVTLRSGTIADLSSTNFGTIIFRNGTLTNGNNERKQLTANLTLDISSGATLGFQSNVKTPFYVYALNDGGTVRLCVSRMQCDEIGRTYTTTTMSSSADSAKILYSDGVYTGAVRMIGRVVSQQTTAGNWAAAPTEITTLQNYQDSYLCSYQETATTFNSGTITKILFSTKIEDTHFSYDTSTGDFDAKVAGLYTIHTRTMTVAVAPAAITNYTAIRPYKNAAAIESVPTDWVVKTTTSSKHTAQWSGIVRLAVGDSIDFRFLHNTGAAGLALDSCVFYIARIGD